MIPAEKAARLAAAASNLVGRSYTQGPLRITVTAPPQVDEFGRLVVWVSATRDGVPLALDLPFIYVNPPINVADPVTLDEASTPHRHGADRIAEPLTAPRLLREAPLEALKAIVADTVGLF